MRTRGCWARVTVGVAGAVGVGGVGSPIALAQDCVPRWLPGQASPGISGIVVTSATASVAGRPVVYVGGTISAAGGILAHNVAMWDGRVWSVLGTGDGWGVNATVQAMLILPGGDLIVGGSFTRAGTVAARFLARWDGRDWSAFAPGLDAGVSGMTQLANGDLIVCGAFTHAGAVAANGIARWDGAAWSTLGSGFDVGPTSVIERPNGRIVATGQFRTAGGGPALAIAEWDGAAWNPLGAGLDSGGRALVNLPDGRLAVGGPFSRAGGALARALAVWDGAAWSTIGTFGGGSVVNDLKLAPNGDLLVACPGVLFAERQMRNYLRWDGARWSEIDPTLTGSGVARCIIGIDEHGDLLATGFTHIGDAQTWDVGRWDGARWHTLGEGIDRPVWAIHADPAGAITVGGDFYSAGGAPAHCIARWTGQDGGRWGPLNEGFSPGDPNHVLVKALAGLPGGRAADDLVAASIQLEDGQGWPVVGRWSGDRWRSISPIVTGEVRALAALPNGALAAAGNISFIGGAPVRKVAAWDGQSWTQMGAGLPYAPSAMVVDRDGDLLACGGIGVVSRWDGAAWSPFAPPIPNLFLTSMAVLPSGRIAVAGQSTPSPVFEWTGSQWVALGDGFDNWVHVLTVDASGRLVAGGGFSQAGGLPASRIARWDGAAWSPMGGGIAGGVGASAVYSLAALPNGDVLAGGSFSFAGGEVSPYFARWVESPLPRITSQPTPVRAAPGAEARFSVTPTFGFAESSGGGGGLRFQWLRDGLPLTDGSPGPGSAFIRGAAGTIDATRPLELMLAGLAPADAGRISVVLSNACGSIESDGADLRVPAACPADFNGDSFIDFFDYDEFIRNWTLGALAADLDESGPAPADPADLDLFLTAFEHGC